MKKFLKNISKIALIVPAFALMVGAFAPVATVYAADCNITGGLHAGKDCAKSSETPDTLFGETGIFTTVINLMLFLIGVLSVIMLIYGGIRYTLSQGDSGAVTNAKNTILYAIVGIVVAILAYAIVNFVITSLTKQA